MARFFLKSDNRMNYAVYMRKLQNQQSRIIGFQNGQDASLVTLKNQAKAATVQVPIPVATSFSKIGGTVGNILEESQQTSSPTSSTCSSGYNGVSGGLQTTDATGSVLASAQHCAVCSDAPSSAPYSIVIPCGEFINPIAYNAPPDSLSDGTATSTVDPTRPTPGTKPGTLKCCQDDPSDLYRNNSELIATEGKAETLRVRFGQTNVAITGLAPQPNGIPKNLQGLRAVRY